MNLIFIYGPPASGKLTVAEEVVKQTGYRLFHNHLTQDLAREIYPEFDETRFGLVDKLRFVTFEYVARHGTDIVFTFVYSGDEADDKFIANTVRTVTSNGGMVLFVQLDAPDDVLLQRVDSDSRKRFHKLIDPKFLREKLESRAYHSSVKNNKIFKLDSSRSQPVDLAISIIEHYKLPKLD